MQGLSIIRLTWPYWPRDERYCALHFEGLNCENRLLKLYAKTTPAVDTIQ